MGPTTIRFPEGLQEELDQEAEHYGYASRSEYIRFLLERRELIHQEMIDPSDSASTKDTEQNQIDSKILDEMQSRLAKLEEELLQLKSIEGAEQTEQTSSQASSDRTKQISSGQRDEEDLRDEKIVSTIRRWLSENGNGPNKDYAQNILLEAIELLDEKGPHQKQELLDELYRGEDDPYKNKRAFWRSTIDEHYEDIPGFIHPKKGQYDFDKKLAREEIDISENINKWN